MQDISNHYDSNGEWCCDREEGKPHDMCWYRPLTFAERHPFLAALKSIFVRRS